MTASYLERLRRALDSCLNFVVKIIIVNLLYHIILVIKNFLAEEVGIEPNAFQHHLFSKQ